MIVVTSAVLAIAALTFLYRSKEEDKYSEDTKYYWKGREIYNNGPVDLSIVHNPPSTSYAYGAKDTVSSAYTHAVPRFSSPKEMRTYYAKMIDHQRDIVKKSVRDAGILYDGAVTAHVSTGSDRVFNPHPVPSNLVAHYRPVKPKTKSTLYSGLPAEPAGPFEPSPVL